MICEDDFESVCVRIYLRVTCCSARSVSEEVQREFTALALVPRIFLSAGGVEELDRQRAAWGGDEDVRRWREAGSLLTLCGRGVAPFLGGQGNHVGPLHVSWGGLKVRSQVDERTRPV